MMMQNLKIAAVALLATTGIASAATTTGQFNAIGAYNVANGTSFDLGETINVVPPSFSTGIGDYAGIGGGVSDFSLITSASPNSNNAGTTFSFGSFLFTITSTETATLNNTALEVFGLGTVTGAGFDVSPSSFRFSAAGASQNTSPSGLYSLFIQTPPEEIEPPVVPLPAGLPLLVGGIAAFGLLRRRNKA